jgi:hypothetical protein
MQGCVDQVLSRGMCAKHYCRWWRHGDANVVLKPGPPPKDTSVSRRALLIEDCNSLGSIAAAARKHGISRQRVWQIVNNRQR